MLLRGCAYTYLGSHISDTGTKRRIMGMILVDSSSYEIDSIPVLPEFSCQLIHYVQPGFLLPAAAASEKTNANLEGYLKREGYLVGLAKGETECLPRSSSICFNSRANEILSINSKQHCKTWRESNQNHVVFTLQDGFQQRTASNGALAW